MIAQCLSKSTLEVWEVSVAYNYIYCSKLVGCESLFVIPIGCVTLGGRSNDIVCLLV